jgi:hypothetical protein
LVLSAARSAGPDGLAAVVLCYNCRVARAHQRFNVFYVLLVAAGILFAVSAFAYFVMAARARNPLSQETSVLMRWMDNYGGLILGMELVALAICTVGAIAWDRFFEAAGHDRASEDRGRIV